MSLYAKYSCNCTALDPVPQWRTRRHVHLSIRRTWTPHARMCVRFWLPAEAGAHRATAAIGSLALSEHASLSGAYSGTRTVGDLSCISSFWTVEHLVCYRGLLRWSASVRVRSEPASLWTAASPTAPRSSLSLLSHPTPPGGQSLVRGLVSRVSVTRWCGACQLCVHRVRLSEPPMLW